MRILILGGDGMPRHRLLQHFSPRHETRVTLRQPLEAYRSFGLFDRANAYDAVDARDAGRVKQVLFEFRPEAATFLVRAALMRAIRGMAASRSPRGRP